MTSRIVKLTSQIVNITLPDIMFCNKLTAYSSKYLICLWIGLYSVLLTKRHLPQTRNYET